MTTSILHAGERAVQQAAGEVAMAERNGALVATTILNGACSFLDKQWMAVMASVDGQGAPWSSILYGDAGFIHADGATAPALLAGGRTLEDEVGATVGRADTLFVAGNHAQTGADASHRGGHPVSSRSSPPAGCAFRTMPGTACSTPSAT
jgi:hypothetical protein